MKNRKEKKTFFAIAGAIILGIFISITMINIIDSDEYYFSTNIIESINYTNGKLIIITRNDMQSVCAKPTKSTPGSDSLCWIDTIDNISTISVYEYKTYYIWVKDNDGKIIYYSKYNVQNN